MKRLLYDVLADHQLWIETVKMYGKRANLSNADLSNTDLFGTALSRVDLSEADLSRANLYGANLSGTDLYRANLSRANLSGADLSEANLEYIIPDGKIIKGIILNWPVIIYENNMSIGCETHAIEDWKNFTDAEIDKMHHKALRWWRQYKTAIFTLISALEN